MPPQHTPARPNSRENDVSFGSTPEAIKPWPSVGMYIHCWSLVLLALLLAAGVAARWSALVFSVGYTYLFLLDRAAYQNHCYLICLLSLLLAAAPSRYALSSSDARSNTVSSWYHWLICFQIAIPYVYGGFAKINSDWLLNAQPMLLWLQGNDPGSLKIGAFLLSWGGALFDLLVVPGLLCARTRLMALALTTSFHLTNAYLFRIGVFPWLMIWASVVFVPAQWLRRVLRSESPAIHDGASRSPPSSGVMRICGVAAVGLFVAVQLAVPLRHLLYARNASWTEEGHDFAWRMKLRDKRGDLLFTVWDAELQRFVPFERARSLVTARQWSGLVHDPENIRQMARAISDLLPGRPAVRVLSSVSLNGRSPQPLVRPDTDLAHERWRWSPAPWIMALEAPRGNVRSR